MRRSQRWPIRGVNAGTAKSASAAGVVLGLLAYALFGVHDATIKWLVASVPVPEVVFVRSVAVFAACLFRHFSCAHIHLSVCALILLLQ